jgi:hypothetical protein
MLEPGRKRTRRAGLNNGNGSTAVRRRALLLQSRDAFGVLGPPSDCPDCPGVGANCTDCFGANGDVRRHIAPPDASGATSYVLCPRLEALADADLAAGRTTYGYGHGRMGHHCPALTTVPECTIEPGPVPGSLLPEHWFLALYLCLICGHRVVGHNIFCDHCLVTQPEPVPVPYAFICGVCNCLSVHV